MRELEEQGSLRTQPKQWLNWHCGLGLNLRTRTPPWMGWAGSEAQGDVRQHIKGDVPHSLGSGGEAALLGAPGKGKRGQSSQAGLAVDHQIERSKTRLL